MNCFQIVSLEYWSQWEVVLLTILTRCELLSNCIFGILVTVKGIGTMFKTALWIAFKLYLWNIGHSKLRRNCWTKTVVNCFQIVSLEYWSQWFSSYWRRAWCCELLSNCIFGILVTVLLVKRAKLERLWIAFKLYLWNIGHSSYIQHYRPNGVVNCFQIVSLEYWSQSDKLSKIWKQRCELLSNCIFGILVTVQQAWI